MSWILDKLFGVDDATATGRALDAQLDSLNRQDLEAGKIDQTEYERRLNEINTTGADHYSAEVDGAFIDGWDEGYTNLTGGVKKALAAPFQFTWDIIPWQLILVALVALFVYLGGWQMLKGRLNR